MLSELQKSCENISAGRTATTYMVYKAKTAYKAIKAYQAIKAYKAIKPIKVPI